MVSVMDAQIRLSSPFSVVSVVMALRAVVGFVQMPGLVCRDMSNVLPRRGGHLRDSQLWRVHLR